MDLILRVFTEDKSITIKKWLSWLMDNILNVINKVINSERERERERERETNCPGRKGDPLLQLHKSVKCFASHLSENPRLFASQYWHLQP